MQTFKILMRSFQYNEHNQELSLFFSPFCFLTTWNFQIEEIIININTVFLKSSLTVAIQSIKQN